jgi:hypothetical protein
MTINNLLNRVYVALMCLLTVTMHSCKKDGSNNLGGSSSKTDLLTKTSWKYANLELKDQSGAWISVGVPSDAKGVTIAFNANGSFVDAGGFDPHSGSWKLSNSDATLTTESSITYGTPFKITNSSINTLTTTTLQLVTDGNVYLNGPDGFPHTYHGERDTFAH